MTDTDPNLRGAHFLRALKGTDICVFFQDADLVYRWIENPPDGWSEGTVLGATDEQLLGDGDGAELAARKRELMGERRSDKLEMAVRMDDRTQYFDLYLEPELEDGRVVGLLGFAVNTTEKKRREHNMRELLLEVSHRSRNMLAIVQSLANHSLRSDDNAPALSRFNERLQSLATTLTVVTQGDWDGAHLHELVRTQMTPFLDTGTTLDIDGDDLVLVPNAAVHVGLAIQELAANSVLDKHSSLVGSDIGIAIEPEADGITFVWHELTGYTAGSSSSRELDAVTLRQLVPAAVNGDADITHEDGKLTYRLHIPASNLR